MVDEVNPHDTTSYGQQQEYELQMKKASGDIRDLYAYYRFSDHQLTSISLKEKTFKKQEVWFEGHMDWTFKECAFREAFHFGVEGERLEEDTRETARNPEPFPPYGSNGLHFELCSFKATFEIKDNCNVIFKNCSFDSDVEEIIIGNGCRVEFIGCSFECAITIEDYCDVKFRQCDFDETQSHFVKATDNCKLYVDRCDLGSAPQTTFFDLEGDCSLTVHNSGTLTSDQADGIVAKDRSHVRAYKMDGIVATTGVAVTVEDDSKFEAHKVAAISSAQGDAVVVTNAEFFAREGTSINSTQGKALLLDRALVRCTEVDTISTGQSTCIDATDSRVFVQGASAVSTGQGTCLLGDGTSFEFNNVAAVTSGQGTAVNLSGAGRSYFRDVPSISSGSGTAVIVESNHEMYALGNTSITSGSGTAVDLDNARFEGLGVSDIAGTLGGLVARGSHLRVDMTGTILGGDAGAGVDLTDCVYDIRNASTISGNFGGFWTSGCRGILTGIGTVDGGQDIGAKIIGCSGPTEWEDIGTITSSQSKALTTAGDLKQLRVINVDSITSEKAIAVTWDQDSGTTVFGYIQTISSEAANALNLTVSSGTMDSTAIDSIEGQQGTAAFVQVEGKLRAYDWKSMTSVQQIGLNLVVSSTGEAFFAYCDEAISQNNYGIRVVATDSAKARLKGFDVIESEQATALSISASDDADVAVWDVSSPVTSNQGKACNAVISGQAIVTMRSIQGLESSQGSLLSVTASGHAQFHAVDFLAECTTDQETAWDLNASGDSKITVKNCNGVSSEQGDAISVTIAADSSILLDKLGTVSSTEGTALGGSVTGDLHVKDLDALETTEGKAIELTGGVSSLVDLDNIATITGTEPGGDLISITGVAHTRLNNIPTIDAGTCGGKIANFTSLGEGLGKIELIDVIAVSASECIGGVAFADCGDISVFCASAKGSVTCDTGAGDCMSASNANIQVFNLSEISNPDASMRGFYATNTKHILLEGVASIEGKNAVYVDVNGDLRIINCDELKVSPDSEEEAVKIIGRGTVLIQGDSTTTIEAKDKDKIALDIEMNSSTRPEVRLHDVEITANKGKALIKNAELHLHNCTFNGSTEFTDCSAGSVKTAFTCGLTITTCQLNLYDTTIDLGANDGPTKDLLIEESYVVLCRSEITGSEAVTVDGSVFEAVNITTPLVGTASWDVVNSVFRGVKAAWGADLVADAETVVQMTKVAFTGKDVELTSDKNVFEGHHFTCKDFTLGANSPVFVNKGTITGNCSLGALTGGFFQEVDIGGNLLQKTTSSCFYSKGLISGDAHIENATSFLASGVTVSGGVSTDGNLGMVLSHCDFGSFDTSSGTGLVAAYSDTNNTTIGSASGVVAAKWTGGTTTFGASGAYILAKADITTVNVSSSCGLVSARGEGAWNSTNSDLGLIFARHETALTYTGADTGVVGACMPKAITFSGSGGVVGASLQATLTSNSAASAVVATGIEVASAGALVGANIDDVTACNEIVIAKSGEVASGTNLIAAGADDVSGAFTNILVLESAGTCTASKAGAFLGGSVAATGTGSFAVINSSGNVGSTSSAGVLTIGGSGTATAGKGNVMVGTDAYGACSAGIIHVGGTKSMVSGQNHAISVGVTGTVTNTKGGVYVGQNGTITAKGDIVGVDCTQLLSADGDHSTLSVGANAEGFDGIGVVGGAMVAIEGHKSTVPSEYARSGISIHRSYARMYNNITGSPTPVGCSLLLGTTAGTGYGDFYASTETKVSGRVDLLLETSNGAINAEAGTDIYLLADDDYTSEAGGIHTSKGLTAPVHVP
jgi:hypothetical protein